MFTENREIGCESIPSDCSNFETQPDDGNEHQQRANQRIQEELNRRVDTILAAPNTDDKVHRDQNQFPKHVEQERVGSHKDASHTKLQEQHKNVEFLYALSHRLPRRQERNWHDQCREQD